MKTSTITIHGLPDKAKVVPVIKLLRKHSRAYLELVDAKAMWDGLKRGESQQLHVLDVDEAIDELRTVGVRAEGKPDARSAATRLETLTKERFQLRRILAQAIRDSGEEICISHFTDSKLLAWYKLYCR